MPSTVALQRTKFRPAGTVESFEEGTGQNGGSEAGNGHWDFDGLPALHFLYPVNGLLNSARRKLRKDSTPMYSACLMRQRPFIWSAGYSGVCRLVSPV